MPKKLRWLRSPTGSNGRPWKNWRLSRNRIRCWPVPESSSPTSSTDRSFANPEVVPELTRKPSGWWCRWRRKIPGGAMTGFFLRHLHHQPLGFLVNSGTTSGFAKLRSVELVGNELSVPGQQRIRFRDSRQFFQGLPFEPVGDLSQRSFFGIG